MKSLSCIIPVYGLNKGRNYVYFEELLQMISIAAKKIMDGAFELIIVNDNRTRISKDNIKDVCAKYGLLDCLIYHENDINEGQAFSRNVGASLASGEYLHFIDQDDYISSEFYESIMKQQEKADIYISLPFFNKNGLIKTAYTLFLKNAYKRAKYISDIWYLLLSNVVYSPGQLIMSKSAYNSVGGFPVLESKGADDFALFYKLIFADIKYRVKFIPASQFYYRIHSQQNSKLSSTNNSACEFLNKITVAGLKQNVIYLQKTKKWAGWLSRIFYVLYFKRT